MFRVPSGVTSGVLGSILVMLSDVATSADRANGDLEDQTSIRSMFAPHAATRILASLTSDAAAEAGDAAAIQSAVANNAVRQLIVFNQPGAAGWFFDLFMASKKKPLSSDNVNGYFLSIGVAEVSPAPIADFFNMIRGYMSDKVGLAQYRDATTGNKWMGYRLTRYSAGPAMLLILPDLIQIRAITEANAALVRVAALAPWDMVAADAIPRHAKGVAYVYYEAAGREIDDWKQGSAAADEIPSAIRKAYKAVFKKFFSLKVNTDSVEKAQNMEQLRALTAQIFPQ